MTTTSNQEPLQVAKDALQRIALNISGDTAAQVIAGEAMDAITALQASATNNEPLGGEKCQRCDGEGAIGTGIEEAPTALCAKCNGTGFIAFRQQAGAAGASDDLPKWIDDLKGYDGQIDDLIHYIINLRAQLADATGFLNDLQQEFDKQNGAFHATSLKLKDAEAQLAQVQAPVSESIDTPEFWRLMCDWRDCKPTAHDASAALIAHIDAHHKPAAQMLSSLLARIHRDGGQREAEIGTEAAVAEADLIVANLHAASAAPQAQGEPVAFSIVAEAVRRAVQTCKEVTGMRKRIDEYVNVNAIAQKVLGTDLTTPAAQADEVRDAARWRMAVTRVGYMETGTPDGPIWTIDLPRPSRSGNTDENFTAAIDALRTTAADNQKGGEQA